MFSFYALSKIYIYIKTKRKNHKSYGSVDSSSNVEMLYYVHREGTDYYGQDSVYSHETMYFITAGVSAQLCVCVNNFSS